MIRYKITSNVVQKTVYIVATTGDKAWAKFVHQYYGSSPMKPNRQDWQVIAHENV